MGAKTIFVLLSIVCLLAIQAFAGRTDSSLRGESAFSTTRPACMKWDRINATAQLGVESRQHHLSWANSDGSSLFVVGGCSKEDKAFDLTTSGAVKEKVGTIAGPCADLVSGAGQMDLATQRWSLLTIFDEDDRVTELKVAEAASAYDPQSDSLLFYGGVTNQGMSKSLRILSPKYNADKTLQGYTVTTLPTKGTAPPALRGASMVVTGPHAFLFGGIDVATNTPTSDLYIIELEGPRALTWRRQDLNVVPSARFGHTLTTLPTHGSYISLVLFGGADGSAALSDVWHLSGIGPELGWARIRPNLAPGAVSPTARYSHGAALVSDGYHDKIVFYGGCDLLRHNCYDTVEILNTLTWEWEAVPASLASSSLPPSAAPTAGGETNIDTDALAARLRSPQGRGGVTMVVLPDARVQRRVKDIAAAKKRTIERRKKNGESVTPAEELIASAESASELSVVRGYRIAVVMGCAGLQCTSIDSRVVSVLDADAICPMSCAIDRGVYVEERGGGTSIGTDVGAEDAAYQPARCECQPGFHGRFCELFHDCPNGCSNNGKCMVEEDDEGASVMFCKCNEGFWGLDCSLKACLNNCSGRGVCVPGADPVFVVQKDKSSLDASAPGSTSHCKCRRGYYGPDCSMVLSGASVDKCPGDCSGHGICGSDGVCQCSAGFTGRSCENQCPGMCSGNGVCVTGDASMTITDDNLKLENGLHIGGGGVGSGSDAVCKCKKGWMGRDCSIPHCAHNCHGRGTCNKDGFCECQAGWGGDFCTIPTDCSGHGKYVIVKSTQHIPVGSLAPVRETHGECQCDYGWGNPTCSQRVFCPHSCSGNGECTLLPPVSDVTRLLQRPVGKDAFSSQSLGGIIPTVNSPEADLNEMLMFQNDAHSLLDISLLSEVPVVGPKGLANTEIEGICKCKAGWRGADCSKRECASQCRFGRGECDDLGQCQCYPGYSGADCGLVVPCPSNCTSTFHGTCNENGTCGCKPGWTGPDCSTRTCPRDCSGNGKCNPETGFCSCAPGFSGSDCSQMCPNKCSEKGVCVDGNCKCNPGHTGADCSQLAHCPRNAFIHPDLDCSGHGFCFRPARKCICEPGYTGKDCSQDDGSCGQGSCGNHGTCRHGQCYCDLGWSGKHCELQNQCPQNCNNHGYCVHGTCHCYAGFEGDSCDQEIMDKNCPKNCSGNGFCQDGKCTCVEGYNGVDCSMPVGFCSETNCNNNGECRFGQCHCKPGFRGEFCEKSGCDSCVDGKGVCVLGECQCLPGFRGPDCNEQDLCPKGCSSHGMCVLGTCACLPGYTGVDCSIVNPDSVANVMNSKPVNNATCTNDCNGNGVCHLGQCFCIDGFEGEDCSQLKDQSCPNNCGGTAPKYNQRGVCRFGKCFCNIGFEGAGCEVELKCPDKCEYNGICMHGKCFCAPGYTGTDCQQKLSPEQKDILFAADINPTTPQVLVANVTATNTTSASNVQAKKVKKTKAKGKKASPVAALMDVDESVMLELEETLSANANAAADIHGAAEEEEEIVEELLVEGDENLAVRDGEAVEILEEEELNEEQFNEQQNNFALLSTDEEAPAPETPAAKPAPATAVVAPKPPVEKSCEAVGGCVHGMCVKEQCLCLPGFAGARCEMKVPAKQWERCPKKCSNKGTCVEGRCYCDLGYAGDDCSKRQPLPCPMDCSGHGICHNGKCFCEPGFEGVSCSVISHCKESCGIHGVCFRGSCVCAKGFTGPTCRTPAFDDLPEEILSTIKATDDDLSLLRLTNADLEKREEATTIIANFKAGNDENKDNVTAAASAVATGASFLDFGGDVLAELNKVADEHAFACPTGCGAHGRCIRGTCYCEPYYTGALCEVKVDENAIASLEAARASGVLVGEDDSVVENESKLAVSPLLIAAVSFIIGVAIMTVVQNAQKSHAKNK